MPDQKIELKQFESGAVREKEDSHARFDLISPIGLRRLAETYGEGSLKYGDENWLKGINAKNLMNHAIAHINKWMAGDTTEDHLAHASWNLFAIMHFEEARPDMMDITSRHIRVNENPGKWTAESDNQDKIDARVKSALDGPEYCKHTWSYNHTLNMSICINCLKLVKGNIFENQRSV